MTAEEKQKFFISSGKWLEHQPNLDAQYKVNRLALLRYCMTECNWNEVPMNEQFAIMTSITHTFSCLLFLPQGTN